MPVFSSRGVLKRKATSDDFFGEVKRFALPCPLSNLIRKYRRIEFGAKACAATDQDGQSGKCTCAFFLNARLCCVLVSFNMPAKIL